MQWFYNKLVAVIKQIDNDLDSVSVSGERNNWSQELSQHVD